MGSLLTACASLVSTSEFVDLGTPDIRVGDFAEAVAALPDATNGGIYAVPSGKVLVVKTVTIYPLAPGDGTLDIQLAQRIGASDRAREQWIVPNAKPTQLDFSPGLVVAADSRLIVRNRPGSTGEVFVSILGYERRE